VTVNKKRCVSGHESGTARQQDVQCAEGINKGTTLIQQEMSVARTHCDLRHTNI